VAGATVRQAWDERYGRSDLQRSHGQGLRAKSFDRFCPLLPTVVPVGEHAAGRRGDDRDRGIGVLRNPVAAEAG